MVRLVACLLAHKPNSCSAAGRNAMTRQMHQLTNPVWLAVITLLGVRADPCFPGVIMHLCLALGMVPLALAPHRLVRHGPIRKWKFSDGRPPFVRPHGSHVLTSLFTLSLPCMAGTACGEWAAISCTAGGLELMRASHVQAASAAAGACFSCRPHLPAPHHSHSC